MTHFFITECSRGIETSVTRRIASCNPRDSSVFM